MIDSTPLEPLCDPVLIAHGIAHGFGQKGTQTPENTAFSDQVHGAEIHCATGFENSPRPAADIVLTTTPGLSVGIVTADCVPILAATRDGRAVAAIHAGWRGLARGAIEAGLHGLRAAAPGQPLIAAVGPAARGCCYEVDESVRRALAEHYSDSIEGVFVPGREDHFQLDLPRLATRILVSNGVARQQIGVQNRACTICGADRFESYRRDAEAAGRLAHFVTRPARVGNQG